MSTTLSSIADQKRKGQSFMSRLVFSLSIRLGEFVGLLLASFVVVLGFWLVYQAKAINSEKTPFAEVDQRLERKELLNLNEITKWQDLLPHLAAVSGSDKRLIAEKIYNEAVKQQGNFSNVGALAKIRVRREDILSGQEPSSFKKKFDDLDSKEKQQVRDKSVDFALLDYSQISQLKPSLIVRRPTQFLSSLLLWAFLAISIFYFIHFIWRLVGFTGDQLILPVIHLLTSLGMILMVSLRDPLRDNLSFKDFSLGILVGGLLLLITSLSDHWWWAIKTTTLKWRIGRGLWTYLPLALACVLSVLLIFRGSGPGSSDAKVNLSLPGIFTFQPVEFIKVLVVFFLAGYFAENWEFLRELKQKGKGVFGWLQRFNIPRLLYFLPVVFAMGLVLSFFYLQKDLGPALVLASTFLALYAVSRNRVALVIGGLAILFVGVFIGYQLEWPSTVYKRVQIWLKVWENGLSGGDQIAHSFWAMATGGLSGTGLGMGDPELIPAGHTDLIISSLGEELGFAGVVIVLVLYAVLIARSLRVALKAANIYKFFLVVGLAMITAWQTIIIAFGILGVFPLSGVVSPFLSYGKSSMWANLIIFGLILAVSTVQREGTSTAQFHKPVKSLVIVLSLAGLVIFCRAGYIQVVKQKANILEGVFTKQGDGSYVYKYNPRLLDVARQLETGTIYDRNNLPLATSDCEELRRHKENLEKLGVSVDNVCAGKYKRYYPFGARLFHLLGDSRTRENWGAKNTNYVERDYAGRLHGYDDRAELITHVVPKTKAEIAKEQSESRRSANIEIQDDDVDGSGDGDNTANEGSKVESGGDVDMQEEALSNEPNNAHQPISPVKVVRSFKRHYDDLLPLLLYRHRPDHESVQRLLNRERNIKLSIDIGLQLKVSELVKAQASKTPEKRGAAVVLAPVTGDVLAVVSYPWPSENETTQSLQSEDKSSHEEWIDRAFVGHRPPGSTFKIVTAIAALRKDERLQDETFTCKLLDDGRVGNFINGFRRPVRDSEGDHEHKNPNMKKAIVESCNAYFAQLGYYKVGAPDLKQTAEMLGIEVARPNTVEQLSFGENLLQGAYGQGEVLATPFRMARVAATIANGGVMPFGRWVINDSNKRMDQPARILKPHLAEFIAQAMRGVVTDGTARRFRSEDPPLAGKTGTAQIKRREQVKRDGKLVFKDKDGKIVLRGASDKSQIEGLKPVYKEVPLKAHSWFIGYAPFNEAPKKVAFAVLIEHGGAGALAAATVSNEIVKAAQQRGLLQ